MRTQTRVLLTTAFLCVGLLLFGTPDLRAQKQTARNLPQKIEVTAPLEKEAGDQRAGTNSGWSRTNYQVYLKTIIGTDKAIDGERAAAGMTDLIGQIGAGYSYSNYYVFTNNFQQVANRGQIQTANIFDGIGSLRVENYPINVTLGLGRIEHQDQFPDEIGFRRLTFTAEVPIKIGEEVGNRRWQYNVTGISLVGNTPTVIGSTPIPQTGETLFFILTVKKL